MILKKSGFRFSQTILFYDSRKFGFMKFILRQAAIAYYFHML